MLESSNVDAEYALFDPDELLRNAQAAVGDGEPESPDFVHVLTRWLESMRTEARLNDLGRASTAADAARLLTNRRRLDQQLRAHPEISDEVVDDPIVITGLARTGTTKLQRLLAAAPAIQTLPYWRLINPTPLPGSAGADPDPRIDVARHQLEMIETHIPEVLALHPMAALEADEEIFAMEMTFDCLSSALRAGPSFLAWWRTRNPRPTYEYLRRLLAYCQWVDGGRRGPWVLKTPAHLGNLDTILSVFPRATIVHCHRDPRESFKSGLRLHEMGKALLTSDLDATQIGPPLVEYWAEIMRQNMAQRQRPEVAEHVVDVSFAEVCSSPLDVAREVLERHGMDFSPDDAQHVEAWLEADQHDARPRFAAYPLERYGVSESIIGNAFGDYIAQFEPFVAGGTPA